MEKIDPRANKSRPEYWVGKLKGEVAYTPTQKNERAISEFAEDIAQHIELINVQKNYNVNSIMGTVDKMSETIETQATLINDLNDKVEENKKWILLIIGIELLAIVCMGLLSWA